MKEKHHDDDLWPTQRHTHLYMQQNKNYTVQWEKQFTEGNLLFRFTFGAKNLYWFYEMIFFLGLILVFKAAYLADHTKRLKNKIDKLCQDRNILHTLSVAWSSYSSWWTQPLNDAMHKEIWTLSSSISF